MAEDIDRSAVGPEHAMEYIQDCLERNIPYILVGPPGIGKTALGGQAAKIVSMPDRSYQFSGFNPTQLTGFGSIAASGDHAEFKPFGFLWEIMNATEPVLIRLEDIGAAPTTVQLLARELFLARSLNGIKVPDFVRFGLSTNETKDKAGITQVITPMTTSCHVIRLTAKADDWCNWADGVGMPAELVAYIRGFPKALFEFNPGAEIKNCPIPRNWERVGNTILHSKIRKELLRGSFINDVGEYRGIEFYSFQKVYRSIPNLRDIEDHPQTAALPEDQIAVITATVSQLYHSAEYRNFLAYCIYVKRMEKMELVKLFMAGIRKRHPELVETAGYTDLELFSKRGY